MQPNLSVTVGRLRLKNPVMVASGTFGYAEEFADFLDLKSLGAVVTKTITVRPRTGNPPGRTCETPAGMLNSIGLENPGLDVFLKEKLPALKRIGIPVVASIASEKDPAEFLVLARRLDKIDAVAAIELNISCPNIRHHAASGRQRLVSQDPAATYALVKAVRKATGKTLITKLSPNVTDIVEIAQAARKAGSDALSLINTLTGMSLEVKTRKPKLTTGIGGLSGPAIRPVAVRMIWEVRQHIALPIVGMGGIIDTSSALEFLIAGATAISVGTANFVNPRVSIEIVSGLKAYLQEQRIPDIRHIIGRVGH
ncbi:MAG TPA: dihydroorotate dehydrogenase [Patescibacteria group bacterium]|nr:dihydroorotate dehydrogenase [Patescibacteria group bacterium]